MSAPTETGPTDAASPVQDLPLPVLGSLSPSRAGDFLQCPLLFRFRTIDRLPQAPSSAATRGTVVHAVLERLFDLPAAQRTLDAAEGLLGPAWDRLRAAEPEVEGLFADDAQLTAWLKSARDLLAGYFTLEDPTRLEPAERERLVEVVLPGGLRLRGIVDRVDRAPTGEVRVVDYKGLALNTPLPTPTGWTTMGEVQVGDFLLGAGGQPCRVVVKSDVHHRPCFEVVFTDGTTVVSDNVHLWSVFTASTGDGYVEQVLSTEALAQHLRSQSTSVRGRRRPFIRAAAPLDLPVVDLPIDPWVLGAWLGDGATCDGRFTVGQQDRVDMLRLFKEHWAGSVKVEPASDHLPAISVGLGRPDPDRCPYGHAAFRTVQLRGRETGHCTRVGDHQGEPSNASLSELLRREGLTGNKHVPPAYLRASREQRLALLRGLMDTDGSWSDTKARAVLVTTAEALASAVRELAHSLGATSTHFTKPYIVKRGERIVHMVGFRPHDFNPFSLPRKAVQVDAWLARRSSLPTGTVQRELRRTIAAVRPVASVPTQCVEVDSPDALYLCGRTLVPTHNTGRSPGEMFEGKALFQMKFYALVLWRTTGTIPRLLQLMYLGDREVLRYSPDEADLLATERKLLALWDAIERATQRREFLPRTSKLCSWCDHQALCPSFGGVIPPWPERVPGPDDPLPHQRRAVEAAQQG